MAKKSKSLHAAYERSKYDNDKGVKEGSKADKARDKVGMAKFKAAMAKKK